ncbi:MAG: hypothetical protein K2N52_00590, partial [Clostridia bacterium]|nr:hypothetical protein [Clostridia bacterium]
QASPVSQVQQPMPVYGQGADNTALLMAKLEAEFARQAQQRSEKELADSKLQSEFDKLRAELRSSGRLPAGGEMHAIADGQSSDIEMIGMLAAAIWRNIKNNGTAATAERLAGQIQTVQQTESEPAAVSYPNNAIITTTTTVDTTNGKEGKTKRKGEKIQRTERDGFSDLDGFYESYEE